MVRITLCVLTLTALAGCKSETVEPAEQDAPDRFAAAELLSIPSDARAEYRVLSVERVQGGHIEIVTRRSGSSGVTFSKRLVDCRRQRFRYLADSETFEGLASGVPSPDWSDLVTGSISWHVVQRACRG